MSGFKNIGISEYFKRYGYRYGIRRMIFTVRNIHIVKEYENKKILYYKRIYKILEKKYYKYRNQNPEGLKFGNTVCKNPVWIYWKQCEHTQPEIVKACISSVKRYIDGEVIVLSDDNYCEYIQFPQYILEKVEKGVMSTAAFSDLLRFSLLEHYGGTWIDATVYMTGKMPSYIRESDFFAFQDTFGLISNPALYSNWLLHSKPGNIVLREVRNMTFEYWRKQKYVMEYLFTYIFITIAVENHIEVKETIPYANSDYCHQMLNVIGEKYNDNKYKHIISMSNIHKLSYKLYDELYSNENNFYHNIIKEYN